VKLEPVDVVVVGAGMGGAMFTARLAERAPHLRIVLIERGGWVERPQMPAYRRDWMRLGLNEWATSPNLRIAAAGPAGSNKGRAPSADYPVDDTGSPIKPLMWSGVGGSTINWAAHVPRLHPSDFRTRTLDGVGDDWPISYDDLEPYYDDAETRMGVSGLAGDPAYPAKRAPRQPPLPAGRVGNTAARAFNALGWHWWPSDAAIASATRDRRPACNGAGPCLMGCPTSAKWSADMAVRDALDRGVTLRTGAVAQRIVMAGGRATGLAYRDAAGEHEQPASFLVVAANGIGTARLLLAAGIGGDAVGRHLMFHPVAYARGMFREELDGPKGPVGVAIYSHEFYERAGGRPFTGAVQLQVTRENSLLQQALRLEPPWGAEAQRLLREEFRHSLPVMVVAEDRAEPANRVRVTGETDDDGLPAVAIDYALSGDARRALDFGLDRAEELLRAAGAFRVARVPLAPYTGWHLLGTARMGADPRTSAADARGRLHDAPNVIVADGSVFPTAGAVNPGITIAALAARAADLLAADAA
jgi:choline dehydrogenase-like flavoprotein